MFLAESYLHRLDPIALPIAGEFAIRWYGLAYLTGFLLGYLALRRLLRTGRMGMPPELLDDFVTTMILAVMLGGRFGHILLYDVAMLWTFSSAFPFWEPLAIWHGGMSSHGGIAGVILGCFWWGRRRGVPGWHALDLMALVSTIGLGLGRVANFINGELVGRVLPDSMRAEPPWWSIKYPGEILERQFDPAPLEVLRPLVEPAVDPTTGAPLPLPVLLFRAVERGTPSVIEGLMPLLPPRYPSQLAQAATDGVLLPLVLVLVWLRPRVAGVVSAWFAIAYGVLRFLTEQIREVDEGVWMTGGITLPMWLSLALAGVGVVLLLTVGRRAGPRYGGVIAPRGGSAQEISATKR